METTTPAEERDALAPDGSDVRLLVSCAQGSMAHFELRSGETSVAVAHRTLDELWYFVGGSGVMWRKSERFPGPGETVEVRSGVAISIPNHTHFQFRSEGSEPLQAVGVTMPPWPGIGDMSGEGECYLVEGPWEPTVAGGMDV